MAKSPSTLNEESTLESSTLIVEEDQQPNATTTNPKFALTLKIAFSWTFNVPSTPKQAVNRIVKNLNKFRAYYEIFICVFLSITLIPERWLSLLLLLVNVAIKVAYLRLLKAFPSSKLLHNSWIDKNLVSNIITQATNIEMFVTNAGLHVIFTLVCTVPIILMHVFLLANEEFGDIKDQEKGVNDDKIVDVV